MRKINMKPNRQKAAILASILAVGIIASLSATIQTVNLTATDTETAKPDPVELNKHIKPANPPALIVQGKASEVLENLPLEKLVESSRASNTEDPSRLIKDVSETPVSVSLHYGNSTSPVETLAITVTNAGTKPIFVHTLGLHGFIRGEEGLSKVSVYRPVISDPYDVVGATTTEPQIVTPGGSLTAYIQDSLDADGFAGGACYSYQAPLPWDTRVEEDKIIHIPSYCTSLPLTWIR